MSVIINGERASDRWFEYSLEWPDDEEPILAEDEETALGFAQQARELGSEPTVFRREVIAGPWQPVEEELTGK